MLVAVLLVAFLATKSCARQQHNISQDEAVAIAQKEIDFDADDVPGASTSRRECRRCTTGPSTSQWTDENGQVVHTEVVLVNANTGSGRP